MEKYIGNLEIREGDKIDFSKLKEVTGYLSVYSNVTFEAPNLASVGGNLYVSSNVTLPNLASVGGEISVYSNVTFEAPNLASVGGNLYVSRNVTFEAPNLKSVGGYLSVSSNVNLNIKFLNKVNYIFADGKVFLIESKKSSKGIIIYSGFNIKGVKNCKITKQDTIYLASKDEFFAHGETVKKAVEDLQFKIVSEKLKKEPIKEDTLFTIQYYRLLTGACEFGVKEWMSSNKIDEGITAKELLPILEKTNAYGLNKFKQLITF